MLIVRLYTCTTIVYSIIIIGLSGKEEMSLQVLYLHL